MELLLGLLAVGGTIAVGARVRTKLFERKRAKADLDVVRRLAEEDVLLLGEELQRLDRRVSGHELDEDARRDYQTALDAYESAQRSADHIDSADQVSRIVDTLSTGRYALACVLARTEGRPIPERRTPCFFNPQHGPATTDVLWTQPGRGTRTVPACAQDAARQAAGENPHVRVLVVDGRRVPYWEAGELLQPYTRGYFPATITEARRDHKAYGASFDAWPGNNYDGDFQRRDPS